MNTRALHSRILASTLIFSLLPFGPGGTDAHAQTVAAAPIAPNTVCRIADPDGRSPEWELRTHRLILNSSGSTSATVIEVGTGRELQFLPARPGSNGEMALATAECNADHSASRYAGCVNLRLTPNAATLEWYNPSESWSRERAMRRPSDCVRPASVRTTEIPPRPFCEGCEPLPFTVSGILLAGGPGIAGLIVGNTMLDEPISALLITGGFSAVGFGIGLVVTGILIIASPESNPTPSALSRSDREAIAALAPELERRGHAIESARSERQRRHLAQETVEWIESELEGRVSDEGLAQLREIGARHLRTAHARIPRRDGGVDLTAGPNPVFVTGSGVGVRF